MRFICVSLLTFADDSNFCYICKNFRVHRHTAMKYIGVHVSAEPTVSVAPEEAHALGAGAFSFCPVDATNWKTAPYTEEDITRFKTLCSDYGYTPDRVLPHASLILNLGSPEARKLNLARISLVDQMRRVESLGLDKLNFHPGAHMRKISEEACLDLVADSVNYALARTEGVTAVIENTAGQGSVVGYDFAQLARIIERVEDKSRVGVCIDTCHAFAAGYDMRDKAGYDRAWEDFDNTVGFAYLRGMHLNDAMKSAGSRIDRHAPIGKGEIGSDFFAMLMADPRMDGIPLILETPDPMLWTAEIGWLRAHDKN